MFVEPAGMNISEVTATLSKAQDEIYQQKWDGYKVPLTQGEIVQTNYVEYSPLNNTDQQKITFDITPAEWLVMPSLHLVFTFNLYKSWTNGAYVPFDTAVATDVDKRNKIGMSLNFIRELMPGIKVFSNYDKEMSNCSNNYINSNEKNYGDDVMERMSYPDEYLKYHYGPKMFSYRVDSKGLMYKFSDNTVVDTDYGMLPNRADTLAHMNAYGIPFAGGVTPIVPNTKTAAAHQTISNDNYVDIMATPAGYTFRVPLYSLDNIFNIQDYWGKNKKIRIEIDITKKIENCFEYIRPITDEPTTAFMKSLVFKLNNVKIVGNEVRLSDSYVIERNKLESAHPNEAYAEFRGDYYERRAIALKENTTTEIVQLNTMKTENRTPHLVLVGLYATDQFTHENFFCLPARNLIQEVCTKVTARNLRVNFSDSQGQTRVYDLTNSETQHQLYQQYLSFINNGTTSTYDLRKQAPKYTKDWINSFSKTFDEYWKRSYDEPLCFDFTNDLNIVENMDSAYILGSNQAQLEFTFSTPIKNAILLVQTLHPYTMSATGSGLSKIISVFPSGLRAT